MKIENKLAECSLLGLMLRDKTCIDEVILNVKAHHFTGDRERETFKAISHVYAQTGEADIVTLGEQLGGESYQYLTDLHNEFISRDVKGLIENVKAKGDLIRASLSLYAISQQEYDTASELISDAQAKLAEIEGSHQDRTGRMVGAAMQDYVAELQRRNDSDGAMLGLPTGIKSLDNKLKGLREGQMIVIAGRPSMGKSTLALNIAAHNALQGKSVAFFSLEVGEQDMIDKIVADKARIPLNLIQDGKAVNDDNKMQRLSKLVMDLKKSKLYFDVRGGTTVNQVRSTCFRLKRSQDLDLVVIDYIQLMRDPAEGRFEKVTNISNGIQQLSRDLKVPIIALSQLSRKCDERTDKRPMTSDLRESGAIEQDADVIIFPFRDAAYTKEDSLWIDGHDEIAEIIIAKIKMGQQGTVYAKWQGGFSRYIDDDHPNRREWIEEKQRKAKQEKQQAQSQNRKVYGL